MLRVNRNRALGVACLILFVYYLVFSNDGSSATDFRSTTEAGLARKHSKNSILRGDLSDQELTDQTRDKLEGILAAERTKDGATAQETSTTAGRTKEGSQDDDTEDVSIAGRKTMQRPKNQDKDKPKYPVDEKPLVNPDTAQSNSGNEQADSAEDPAKDMAREQLHEYLKKPSEFFADFPESSLLHKLPANVLTFSSCHIFQIVLST